MDEYVFPFEGINEPELNDVLSDTHLPFDYFNSLVYEYNQSRTNENERNSVDYVDEAVTNENLVECKYFDDESFSNLSPCLEKLSALFCNINSVPKNLDTFTSTYLNKYKPMVLSFCEARLDKNTEDLYPLEGYIARFNSRNSRGGGLITYIKSSIPHKVIPSMCVMTDYVEALGIEINLDGEIFCICSIYRKPGSDFEQFMNAYQDILRNIGNKKCIIGGDLNLDLLKYYSCTRVESFANLSFEHSFVPLINKPTRVTSHIVRLS